jgi:carbon storage regulator
MLVLSRKVGERIQLGDNITVTLVKIHGNTVRLGIEAPSHMAVVREELVVREGRAERAAQESIALRVTTEPAPT